MFSIYVTGSVTTSKVDFEKNSMTGVFTVDEYQDANAVKHFNYKAYIGQYNDKITGTGSRLNEGQRVGVIGNLDLDGILHIESVFDPNCPVVIGSGRIFEVKEIGSKGAMVCKLPANTSFKSDKDQKYADSIWTEFFVPNQLKKTFSDYTRDSDVKPAIVFTGALAVDEYNGKSQYKVRDALVTYAPRSKGDTAKKASSKTSSTEQDLGISPSDIASFSADEFE